MSQEKKIILFDGVCNLCNGAVVFIIKRDKNNVFQFAPLQSETAQKLLSGCDDNLRQEDSIILVEGDTCSSKSTAALRIARHLSGGYPLLTGFLILPKFIRDGVYDFIAKRRYRWFGKKEACMIPTPELKSKFLD
ncbi:thiol-disulfide oxidoreductase DCC family protein [Croceiramulus getboli]|nr:thiol-disulfide oxidoreductase DCC family protein [Flavobacteriaceae bacterium YJPT1-3]